MPASLDRLILETPRETGLGLTIAQGADILIFDTSANRLVRVPSSVAMFGGFGETPQALSGTTLGALSLTTRLSTIVTTGAATATLADGYEGQEKAIVMLTDGGDCVLTPTNLRGGTTLTFGDVGDGCLLKFVSTKWNLIGNQGVALG